MPFLLFQLGNISSLYLLQYEHAKYTFEYFISSVIFREIYQNISKIRRKNSKGYLTLS